MQYIHQQPEWPFFKWDADQLADDLADVSKRQGFLLGQMSGLGFAVRKEACLEALTAEIMKSSAIEGETLDYAQVRSSLARKLGIDIGGLAPINRHVEGIVAMMLDATQNYHLPLTAERLFNWHAALFPTGRSELRKISVGEWRSMEDGPMQVVSGPFGRGKVHFEAPSATLLDQEMQTFLHWFNETGSLNPLLKAGVAHLWFVTIHPFADGNGRIARAIADLALARADGSTERFYSMSTQIEKERKEYYAKLESTQKGGLEITPWLQWFITCLGRAIDNADKMLNDVMRKARVWDNANQHPINQRQRIVINCLLDNFIGNLTSSKYAKLAKCSQDTALRDIHELLNYGVLERNASGGRSTSYLCVIANANHRSICG
jgi:Fic family protein